MNVLGGFIIFFPIFTPGFPKNRIILCFACFEGFCPFQCTNLYQILNILEYINVLGGLKFFLPFLIMGVPKIGLLCDMNVLKDSTPFNAPIFTKIQAYMNK